MIRTAFVGTIAVFIAILALLLNELVFLAPIKGYIWEHYAEKILLFFTVLALNVFFLFYGAIRWTRLHDTGEKLRHLEKQLRGKETISEELTSRILERK